MKKITKEVFDAYLDEVLCRTLPNEPYAQIKYPIKYTEWKRDVALVGQVVFERMGEVKWYHEFRDEINELISITCLATKLVNEVADKNKIDREKLAPSLPQELSITERE